MASPISVTRVTAYRNPVTGRFVRKDLAKVQGAERVTMDVQRRSGGRFLRATQVLSRKTTLKTAYVDPLTGAQPGRLDWALYKTNITTRLKDARKFEITIRGKDARDKARRIKHVIYVGKGTSPSKASDYMIWGVVEALRRRGYRTQYNLEEATFTFKEWTKAKSSRMKVLHDVEVSVRVFKR